MPADPPALATADLRSLTTEALEEGLCGFAARLAAATCVFILAIAEYDRRRAWEAWECRSMAHWLTWKCAMGPVAAREHVRVGAALAALPVVRSQFATGAISYSQARAITRVATADTEETFVEMAKAMTAAQLERLVRAYRRARPVAADPTTASRALRGLQWCYDDDGSVVGRFRLAPDDGALVVKALQAATASRAADRADATEDCLDPALDVFAANQADGLIDLATAYLNRRAKDEGSAGDDDRYLVTIVAERRVLQAEGGDDDGVCEIDGGPGLEVRLARRITCDQPTVTILEDARGQVLDVGRKTRRINRRLRRALRHRDRQCCFPGCGSLRMEAHHVKHWIDGGRTSLDNLVSLCRRHHQRHHDGAYSIQRDPDGSWTFVLADGRTLPSTMALPGWDGPPDAGVDPGVATCTPQWDGRPLRELPFVVGLLLDREGLGERPDDGDPDRWQWCDSLEDAGVVVSTVS